MAKLHFDVLRRYTRPERSGFEYPETSNEVRNGYSHVAAVLRDALWEVTERLIGLFPSRLVLCFWLK